jgi:mono/diheme cytochrome c family protein
MPVQVVSASRPCYRKLIQAVLDVSLFFVPVALILAQTQNKSTLKLDTGEEIFQAACAGCHGLDGKGQPQSRLGFEPPATFPDFTDCRSATVENNSHWASMIRDGGSSRGFSPIMPSFGEALTMEQINKVIGYLRTFCDDPHWPQGDLNLPRPLVTEKAFPEDEVVLTSAFNVNKTSGINNMLVYEKRAGARNNIEVIVPGTYQQQPSGSWFGSVGDISLEFKRVMFHSNKKGSIFSMAGEVTLPTGDSARGLGNGVTLLESFVAYDQLFPKKTFALFQAGGEMPTRLGQIPSELFLRTAVGKSFNQNRGLGRTWSPMVEFVAARELAPGAQAEWDVVPQMQVTLNKRQHIRANLGFDIPFSNTAGRATTFVFYLLWDWFDGGLRDGWR